MKELFTIDCGEIILREFLTEDAEAIYQLTSQPEVYEFLPDWRSTKEQRAEWLKNYEIPDNKKFIEASPEITNEFLKLGMILKETNEFIGFCNTGIKEGLNEPNREIAYAVSKRYRNRGYTTQAVQGLIRYLFENTNVKHVNAVILPQNTASNKVIKKCGFAFCEEIELEGQLHYRYILKNEGIK
ncbi:GNAT family N-acetyltransferase [Oceanobacillus neutriphilus]|uniref:N-acetyltransferase n=1 Tax=Oceanobacillus neutriphilus TaxID=531815 RepID=A0ABQ2P0P0_9BACI|nr:GNAT family N-acetyltransferase [Oceanobacillus neutriphilus]GGP15216.1 N-acetyltransferase [Oceanobacillus neutriphilus]